MNIVYKLWGFSHPNFPWRGDLFLSQRDIIVHNKLKFPINHSQIQYCKHTEWYWSIHSISFSFATNWNGMKMKKVFKDDKKPRQFQFYGFDSHSFRWWGRANVFLFLFHFSWLSHKLSLFSSFKIHSFIVVHMQVRMDCGLVSSRRFVYAGFFFIHCLRKKRTWRNYYSI